MANEKFYFLFSEEPNKKVYIDEPINYRDVDFNLDRQDDGMGLDVSLSGGKLKFKFTDRRNHQLEKLLYYNHIYGFETNIKLVIVLENGDEFVSEMDFSTAETNDYNYFECSTIVQSSKQVFKRRRETKVDMFSGVAFNGDYIEPLVPMNMLLQAKPVVQKSLWETKSENVIKQLMFGNDRVIFFPALELINSDIKNSFVPFSNSIYFSPTSGSQDEDLGLESYNYVQATSKLRDLKVKIKIGKMNIDHETASQSRINLAIMYGNKARTDRVYVSLEKNSDAFLNLENKEYEVIIPNLEVGQKIWFNCAVTQLAPISTGRYSGIVYVSFNDISMSIEAESTAYNSVTPTFRLIDVMKQITKSVSGLNIFAPRYNVGGEFYDTVLTNGKLLGGNLDDPFYVSWKDIEESIVGEHHADSEVNISGDVFVGIEKDFFTQEECGFFDNTQFSALKKQPNQMYCLNTFKFNYSNYQSQKELVEANSGSTIHGESILTFANEHVENTKECKVSWIRDAILLDSQQRISTAISKDTATQDDDKIFAIDTLPTTTNQEFTETTNIFQTNAGYYLSFRSDGSVNFLVLGIRAGTTFKIMSPDPNAKTYTVQDVSNNEIKLFNASIPNNNGERFVKYTYEIKTETIPLTNRTDEGFSTIANLLSPEKYSNLRYSVQRNIRNYWDSFLATANLYRKTKAITNTFYKNNGDCILEGFGLRTKEKENFIPTSEPIVTPFVYNDVVFANVDFIDFIDLQKKIRTYRGFIRTIDNNSRVLKLYPLKMMYENASRSLTITGQEKFQKDYLTITKENGLITINNETIIIYIKWEFEEGNKLLLFDNERQRLYNGVYWDKVSVNGAIAPTITVLEEWLALL